MPEALPETPTLAPVVRNFYARLFAKEAEVVAQVIDEHFAPDVVLHRPESLPGGGRLDGADAVKRFFLGAIKGAPLEDYALAGVVDGGRDLVAELTFPGGSALEAWAFDEDLKVTGVRAFYWDTAAMTRG